MSTEQQFPPATIHSNAGTLINQLTFLRDTLLEGLVERDSAVRLALLAALAGEHLLLIGPPGTAKSLLARRLKLAFRDAVYFERLLTKFSVPEELFGPLSIRALEEDRYVRQIQGYLPSASIAFLDEIFKANSAILNALLTLLNEREFDNGGTRNKTPLISVIGASNELPEGEELQALYDRFLLRLYVAPVSDAGFSALLNLRGDIVPAPDAHLLLTPENLHAIQEAARHVAVPADVMSLLQEMRSWLAEQQIPVSDRRWRKIVHLLQVSAITNGRNEVSIWDAWLLQHCTWHKPEEREKVYAWYESRVGASAAEDPERLTKVVNAWESRLKSDQESRTQIRDEDGHPLFIAADGTRTRKQVAKTQKRNAQNQPLYLSPEPNVRDRTNDGKGYTRDELNDLTVRHSGYGTTYFVHWQERETYLAEPNNWLLVEDKLPAALEPTRYSQGHISGCIRQVDTHLHRIKAYLNDLDVHISSLTRLIHGHLWIEHEFAGPARKHLEQTRGVVEKLLARLRSVRAGFEGLPRQPTLEP